MFSPPQELVDDKGFLSYLLILPTKCPAQARHTTAGVCYTPMKCKGGWIYFWHGPGAGREVRPQPHLGWGESLGMSSGEEAGDG